MTRTIGASQSGTLDGGPVTWTPPGVLGFARDDRPRRTRVDFAVRAMEVPRSTGPKSNFYDSAKERSTTLRHVPAHWRPKGV